MRTIQKRIALTLSAVCLLVVAGRGQSFNSVAIIEDIVGGTKVFSAAAGNRFKALAVYNELNAGTVILLRKGRVMITDMYGGKYSITKTGKYRVGPKGVITSLESDSVHKNTPDITLKNVLINAGNRMKGDHATSRGPNKKLSVPVRGAIERTEKITNHRLRLIQQYYIYKNNSYYEEADNVIKMLKAMHKE